MPRLTFISSTDKAGESGDIPPVNIPAIKKILMANAVKSTADIYENIGANTLDALSVPTMTRVINKKTLNFLLEGKNKRNKEILVDITYRMLVMRSSGGRQTSVNKYAMDTYGIDASSVSQYFNNAMSQIIRLAVSGVIQLALRADEANHIGSREPIAPYVSSARALRSLHSKRYSIFTIGDFMDALVSKRLQPQHIKNTDIIGICVNICRGNIICNI